MNDPQLSRITGSSLDEFLESFGAIHRTLPPELQQRLKDVFVNYLTKYGGDGAFSRMNNRTVAQIFAEFVPAVIQPVQSGTINGVEYQLYFPEEKKDHTSATMWQFEGRQVPHIQTALPGPKARALLDRDNQYTSPSYTRVYPLVCARGSGAVIEDVDGNLFLDFTAGIAVCATGHCHPKVTAAIQDQAGKLIHMSGTDFYYEPQIDLAQRLAELAPGKTPKRVFFTNSGAEALEAGLKLARWHTHRSRAIAFFGAFHGRTYGAMSLSGSKLVHRRGFSPLVPDIHHVPYPRGCQGCLKPGDVCTCVKQIEETVFKRVAPPEEVAAIFVEPIQGEGGYHVPPPGFLPALRALCDKYKMLLVADEVQTGMGRTGKMFAVEHWNVEPDILCLAKGIASGMPLGAMIARGDVMDWPPGSHASTFGGNPVSCRAASATIELLQSEYIANAAARGEQLRAGLRQMRAEFPIISDVRGLGLMTAMDLGKSPSDPSPHPELREHIVQTAFTLGLLLLGCGESAIRFCPPLCIDAKQVDIALQILREIFRAELNAGTSARKS